MRADGDGRARGLAPIRSNVAMAVGSGTSSGGKRVASWRIAASIGESTHQYSITARSNTG